MKKIIILFSCFILTGCFENSGYIVKSCIKEETANTLTTKTTYTFGFKNDIIDDIKIIYDYIDSNYNTISSIKLSIETQNKFYKGINYNVLLDEENQYKIEYTNLLNLNSELKDKFKIKETRSDLVKFLENEGYICE